MDMLRFAMLVSWISAAAGKAFDDSYDINMLYSRVKDCFPPSVPNADPKLVDNLLACMKTANEGGFIEAIKAYRTLTGLGLKESKDAIEKYR